MLPVAPLTNGEEYATPAQIRDVDDLAEMPVEVPHWQHEDGQPYKLLLRALSFQERAEVNTIKNEELYALETCLHGIKAPRLTRPQLEILKGKNAEAIDEIADTIWSLTAYPARNLREEIRRLAGLPPAEDPQEQPGEPAGDLAD